VALERQQPVQPQLVPTHLKAERRWALRPVPMNPLVRSQERSSHPCSHYLAPAQRPELDPVSNSCIRSKSGSLKQLNLLLMPEIYRAWLSPWKAIYSHRLVLRNSSCQRAELPPPTRPNRANPSR
jgi:hypothetical protein